MSPRPGPRRPLIAFRPSQEGLEFIDGQAAKHDLNRSEALRKMLAFAAKNMRARDWKA